MVAFKTGLRVAILMIGLALVNSDPLLITRRHKRQSPRDLLPEWLSKRLPFNTKPNTADRQSEISAPKEVLNWPSVALDVGQISGVAVDEQSNPVILHRGPVIWDGSSFDLRNRYRKSKSGAIDVDTVLVLDQRTGVPISTWGRNLFYMPHGLHIDNEGNTWITDVALHQVFKFPKGSDQPSMSLGEAFVPGSDELHFCKPTDVAVASDGTFFVADGYCNQRIMKFDANGTLIDSHEGSFSVPHSLVLIEEKDLLCVADRENSRIKCLNAGLRGSPMGRSVSSTKRGSLGRVYAVASDGKELFAVTGPNFLFRNPDGYSLDFERLQLTGTWSPQQGFGSPHDVEVSTDGTSLYTVQIGPNRITKFSL